MDLKQALFGKGRTLGRTLATPQALIDLTGSLQAAHVLSQVAFRWFGNGRKPFYKFNAPCDHPLYRPGDSWTEELHMGKDAFVRARSRVAVKVTTGTSKREAREKGLILYWTDSNRVTWYELNERLLVRLLKQFLKIRETECDIQDVGCRMKDEGWTVDGVDKSERHPIYLEEQGSRFTYPSNPTAKSAIEETGIVENSVDIIEGNGWWQRALRELQGQMTRATYERLLLGSQAHYTGAGALRVTVRDKSAAIHLQRLTERVRGAVVMAGGEIARIEFVSG